MLTFLQELRKVRAAFVAALLCTRTPGARRVAASPATAVSHSPKTFSQHCAVGIVGGSDLVKISEQLGPDSASTKTASATPLTSHTRTRNTRVRDCG
jgi:hypothetical protein